MFSKFSKQNIIKAILMAICQVALLTLIYILCYHYVKEIINENKITNAAWLNPAKNDVGLTAIDWEQVKQSHPEPVQGGMYLDRIQDFDIVRSKWSYEFYAWFKWNPQRINFIDLRDSVKGAIAAKNTPIKIVNGDIENIETHSFFMNSKGDSAYILFHISGSTTKFFDVSEYPLDNYLLTIQLEHVTDDIHKFVFVPDTINTNVSSRVSVNGFEKNGHFILSKPHTIKSTLGDPRKASNQHNTYSQLRLALSIKRGGFGLYLKIFITLYIAALLAFLSFFAAENDKIRVIVGSLFFAAATLNIIINKIPSTNIISIAEIINDISLITVLLIAGRETLVKFLVKKNHELDVLTKWMTFFITLIFYIVINITIPLASIG